MAEPEREVLLHYLQKNRDAVVRVSDGLSDEEQRAAGVASGTNLLGLVLHLTRIERHWFEGVFLGDRPGYDESMMVPAGSTRSEVVAGYRRQCLRSDEIVCGCADLSTLSEVANPGEDERVSLRVILAHMIEETARHAGQADILREQIDGATEL